MKRCHPGRCTGNWRIDPECTVYLVNPWSGDHELILVVIRHILVNPGRQVLGTEHGREILGTVGSLTCFPWQQCQDLALGGSRVACETGCLIGCSSCNKAAEWVVPW